MSEIVLGICTSHSPLLTFDAATWLNRAEDDLKSKSLNLSDGRFVSYEALLAEFGSRYETHCTLDFLSRQETQAQLALNRLADEIERAAPDVAIVIGDDHGDMFSVQDMPGIAVYYGQEVVMHDYLSGRSDEDTPRWLRAAVAGYGMDGAHRFPGDREFSLQLIDQMLRRGVDLSVASEPDGKSRGLGHAVGFIIKRLFHGRSIPVVPLIVNTYFKPNVIRPERCHAIGQHLAEAISAIPGGKRVVIIGSGGLSHFVTDENLDRRVIAAIRDKDDDVLKGLPMEALNSGSSEILCWVVAAGAMRGRELSWSEYLPVYRTPAGSGVGLAFLAWQGADR